MEPCVLVDLKIPGFQVHRFPTHGDIVVWTSGNHQVDSHSSKASYCARFSLFRALVGSTSGMGLIVSWITPPRRGGHGQAFGGHGYFSASSCNTERAAYAYGVAVGTPPEAAGALVAIGCGALVAAACGAAGSVDEPHEITSASKNMAIKGSNRLEDVLIRPVITAYPHNPLCEFVIESQMVTIPRY